MGSVKEIKRNKMEHVRHWIYVFINNTQHDSNKNVY